jgi:hypothetical protein
MTLIPLALSVWAVIRLQGTDSSGLLWTIVGVTIVAWLTNQAVRNSAKMEGKDSDVTSFWVKASMVMFIANCGVAIAGLVVDKGAGSMQANQEQKADRFELSTNDKGTTYKIDKKTGETWHVSRHGGERSLSKSPKLSQKGFDPATGRIIR